MELQPQPARALAYLLNQIRPDWPVPSILALMEKNRDIPSLGALTVAAVTKAMEPTCRTPAPIWAAGPHWPPEARTDLPPPRPCPAHPSYHAHNCGGCRADRIAEAPAQSGASVIQGDK